MAFYMIKLISKFLKKGELNNSIDAKSYWKENSQVNSAQLYSTSFFYALFINKDIYAREVHFFSVV